MGNPEASTANGLLNLEAENARLRQEIVTLRHFIDSMQNLMEAVETPHPDTEVMDLLEELLDNALRTINAKDGSLLVLDEDTNELVFVLAQGDIPKEQLTWRRLPPGQGIAGWVAANRCATIVNNAREDERFYSEVDKEFEFKTNSVLAGPIVAGKRVLGVIEILNKHDGKLFSVGDQTLLTLMCRFAGELLENMIRHSSKDAQRALVSPQ